MNAKEYLSQVYIIEKIIASRLRDLAYWKELAESISGINLEEHFNPNRPEEAQFVHCFEMISEIQEEIDRKTAELMAIRKEIDLQISQLKNYKEQLVLRYRYLSHMRWDEISRMLEVCERSVFRIHGNALKHFPVPEMAVCICQ